MGKEKRALIEYKMAVVDNVLETENGKTVCLLKIEHPVKHAINYNFLTGYVSVGDTVLVNTTACSLKLGTGGYHFIIANMNLDEQHATGIGHCIKMKYTPMQIKVLMSEEPDSPHHDRYNYPVDFSGKLVFIGELHSMLAPICSYLKYHRSKIRIAYIMNDHGALPLYLSRNVEMLRGKKLIDTTITTGNAFGGDYECVNIYTSLRTALNIDDCDVAIVTSGPGVCGTGTRYGFSTLESAFYADMVASMGGSIIYIPRLGFNDKRNRHIGISHHTLTVLGEFVHCPLPLVLPLLSAVKMKTILCNLKKSGIDKKHRIILLDGRDIKKAMDYYGLNVETMGKDVKQEPDFFYALGAVGKYGLKALCGKPDKA